MKRLILILKYALLGIVQGISEMLPISSSGHMKIIKELFNISNDNLSLEILFHLASLLALCIFFSSKLKRLIVGNYNYLIRRKKEDKCEWEYFLKIIVASIPAGIIGLLFKDKIESIFSDVIYVGLSLLFTSLILYLTYKKEERSEEITYSKSFKIGLFQGLGIIPGISRSGITFYGAKCNGLNSEDSSSFIFLMLFPVTLGSFLLSLDEVNGLLNIETFIPSLVGFLLAFVFTLVSLNLFTNVMKDKKIVYFSLYCFVVGSLTILFL